MGIGLALPGTWISPISAGIGFACTGAADAGQVIAIHQIVFENVPRTLGGRGLSATGSLNQAAGLVGMAVAGSVGGILSPAGALLLACS